MYKWEKEIQQSLLDSEEAAIKALEANYKAALKDINDKVKLFDADIKMLDTALETATEEDRARLLSMRRSKIYQKKYQEALKSQVSGILDKMQSDNYTTIDKYLKDCYEDAFVGTMYSLSKQGIPMIFPIDQAQVVQAVLTDSKISKGLYEALGVDTGKLKKSISAEISRGIASGLMYADIARNISNASNAPFSRAKVIARTEGHRIQNKATDDAAHKAKSRGADVVKQWDSAMDGKTRPTHREIDGQIRELDEDFEVAGKKAKAPGYFGDPAEDCNCRCTYLTRSRLALGDGFTKMDNFTGELREFESPKDYEDFKKKYWSKENIDYMNYVDTLEKQYGTKDFNKLLGQMTDQEYKRFNKLESASPMWKISKIEKTQKSNMTVEKSGNSDIIHSSAGVTNAFDRKARTYDIDQDLAAVNPNYSTGEWKWTNNCQRCVPTYEMRRRGYRVTAKPIPSKNDTLYMDYTAAWRNQDRVWCLRGSGKKQVIEQMTRWGDGARAEIAVAWNSAGGHVFVAEQINGKTVFRDPQNPAADVGRYFKECMHSATSMLRIDNNEPSELILECCLNSGD